MTDIPWVSRVVNGKRIRREMTAEEQAEALPDQAARSQRLQDLEDQQSAMELGKWLDRKERNDRALNLPNLPVRLRRALERLNARVTQKIAALLR